MKRPSFQFYPGDWLRATELRSCSVGARGLWIDMICLMHEGSPYGHLKVGEKVILPDNLARMVGATLPEVQGWLEELEAAGVFSRDDSGCIFSRRMVKDENLRKIRAEGGKLGGNPALLKVRDKVNLQANLEPTPASASASASAIQDQPPTDVGGSPAGSDDPAEPKAAGIPDCPHQQLIELYHELLPLNPRVIEWTETRQALMRSRWRIWASKHRLTSVEDGIAIWRRYFEHVSRSAFLTGQTAGRDGKPPFCPNLEWLIRPANLAKIVEGNYHEVAA